MLNAKSSSKTSKHEACDPSSHVASHFPSEWCVAQLLSIRPSEGLGRTREGQEWRWPRWQSPNLENFRGDRLLRLRADGLRVEGFVAVS